MNQVILPGRVVIAGRVKNINGFAEVKNAKKTGEILLLTKGLAVSICGGSNLALDHPVCLQAKKIAQLVIKAGGVLVNGGENAGSMLAVAEIAKDKLLGVACPYHPFNPYSQKAIVSHYQTRKMVIISVPIIVAFEGQVGTLDEVIAAVGWIKSAQKQGQSPPTLFVSDFWQPVFQVFKKKKIIQENVWPYIKIFKEIEKVLKEIII